MEREEMDRQLMMRRRLEEELVSEQKALQRLNSQTL
jgi:hypothetical protein